MTTTDQPPESGDATTASTPVAVDSRRRSGDVRREGKFCGCGMQLSLTGVCVNCD
ncbi:hypothetical protein [Mycobacterium paraterrae]|uniref:Uncharacterized protein n=1 Tax=Mycobacterium paraterrae TaxID=577492 RepID=A0ABY3VK84_9MYCO|nr:hypothetical protein [Mycobacterium paraterrae]UMB69056.1 hypothetical protein MKK62_22185 [Mycobacterium paraterrae]